MSVYVIDANIIIHSTGIELPFENMMTVPKVTAELSSVEARRRFDRLDVNLESPSEAAMDQVKTVRDRLGAHMSETDVDLVALALDEDATLVTDDYAMQNVAEELDITYQSFVKEGIEESIRWKKVCTNCGRDVDGEQCSVCGAETTKVPE